jgi:hypothetical protein
MTLRGRWLAVGALAATAALHGCGADSIPQAPQTLNIHTTGDSVTVLGGLVTVIVPPGAVSEDGNLTVATLNSGSVPSSPLLVGNSAISVTLSPGTLQILQPITVRVSYASLSLPSGVRAGELRLNRVTGGTWRPVAGGTDDSGAKTVSAAVTSVGDFGVVALPVASLDVSPPSITLASGATQSITATPKDSLGGMLPDREVTFTSSDPAKARVASSGLVTAVAAGSATITVTCETASVQVPVTIGGGGGGTVSTSRSTVSVSTTTVPTGGTVTLTLQAKDGSGTNLTSGGLAVIFSASGGTSTGTISTTTDHSDGTYTATFTGLTAGTATTIHATINGAAVTSTLPTITVTTAVAGECANPQAGWIWCDDFEQNRLSSYFEYDNSGGDFARAAGVGLNGTYGMRARWSSAGQVSAGALHLAFGKVPSGFSVVDGGTQIYRDIYWRMYVRTQPGWTGGSAVKLSRGIVFASSNWAEAAIAHVWGDDGSASPYLGLDPVRGTDASGTLLTTTYNDFAHFTWLGWVQGSKPLFANNQAGNWFCVEAHMKLNDAGQSNGVFETWINDTLDARASNLNFLGSYSTYGINAVFFENYWNAGAVQPEERYFDNVVVSTQRIGC